MSTAYDAVHLLVIMFTPDRFDDLSGKGDHAVESSPYYSYLFTMNA
jgi:hypothetical protein